MSQFNDDETPVFLVSLKAGGTGLNFTGASVVVHADPWWNAAATDQATDRAHRIGQNREVDVYKVVARAPSRSALWPFRRPSATWPIP